MEFARDRTPDVLIDRTDTSETTFFVESGTLVRVEAREETVLTLGRDVMNRPERISGEIAVEHTGGTALRGDTDPCQKARTVRFSTEDEGEC